LLVEEFNKFKVTYAFGGILLGTLIWINSFVQLSTTQRLTLCKGSIRINKDLQAAKLWYQVEFSPHKVTTHKNYYTGEMPDMRSHTFAAQKTGITL